MKAASPALKLLRESVEADNAFLPSYISAGQLIAENPELRDYAIHGLLRTGEVMNVIAAPKVGKSWLVLSLLLSIATGRPWLGRFMVRQGKVLLIDNELHTSTLSSRLRKVAEAMGIAPHEYADTLMIESLRGRLKDLDQMDTYFRAIPPDEFVVVCLDAWYRFLPAGKDENSNADICQLYNTLDRYASLTNAAFVLIHHASKGGQADKSITDVGAGAGAQSRAADAHLVIRHHEEKDAVVVDAVARSSAPPDPFCMRWTYPQWIIDDDLDPTKLRKPPPRTRKPKDEAEQKPIPEPWTVERFVAECASDKPEARQSILMRATAAGMSQSMGKAFITTAIDSGQLHKWPKGWNQPDRFATVPPPKLEAEIAATE